MGKHYFLHRFVRLKKLHALLLAFFVIGSFASLSLLDTPVFATAPKEYAAMDDAAKLNFYNAYYRMTSDSCLKNQYGISDIDSIGSTSTDVKDNNLTNKEPLCQAAIDAVKKTTGYDNRTILMEIYGYKEPTPERSSYILYPDPSREGFDKNVRASISKNILGGAAVPTLNSATIVNGYRKLATTQCGLVKKTNQTIGKSVTIAGEEFVYAAGEKVVDLDNNALESQVGFSQFSPLFTDVVGERSLPSGQVGAGSVSVNLVRCDKVVSYIVAESAKAADTTQQETFENQVTSATNTIAQKLAALNLATYGVQPMGVVAWGAESFAPTVRECIKTSTSAYKRAVSGGTTRIDQNLTWKASDLNASATDKQSLADCINRNLSPAPNDTEKQSIVTAIAGLAFVNGAVATAPSGATPNVTAPTTSCNVQGGLGWIICPTMTLLSNMADAFFALLQNFFEITPALYDNSNTSNAPLYSVWLTARNLANAGFVAVFLIMIYSIITGLGIKNYTLKRMAPRIIVAAVLVNSSYWICALMIDLSNVLGATIKDMLESVAETISLTSSFNTWSAITTGALSVGAGLAAVPVAGVIGGAGFWAIFSLLVPLLISALLAMFTAVVVLIIRQAFILLAIVIAPLAFLAFLLPNTEKLFDKWKNMFITLLVMYPIIAALFGLCSIAAKTLHATSTSTDGIASATLAITSLAIQAIPLFLVPFIMKTSSGLLNRFAGIVNDKNKGFADGLKNKAIARNKGILADGKAWRLRRGTERKNAPYDEANAVHKEERATAQSAHDATVAQAERDYANNRMSADTQYTQDVAAADSVYDAGKVTEDNDYAAHVRRIKDNTRMGEGGKETALRIIEKRHMRKLAELDTARQKAVGDAAEARDANLSPHTTAYNQAIDGANQVRDAANTASEQKRQEAFAKANKGRFGRNLVSGALYGASQDADVRNRASEENLQAATQKALLDTINADPTYAGRMTRTDEGEENLKNSAYAGQQKADKEKQEGQMLTIKREHALELQSGNITGVLDKMNKAIEGGKIELAQSYAKTAAEVDATAFSRSIENLDTTKFTSAGDRVDFANGVLGSLDKNRADIAGQMKAIMKNSKPDTSSIAAELSGMSVVDLANQKPDVLRHLSASQKAAVQTAIQTNSNIAGKFSSKHMDVLNGR